MILRTVIVCVLVLAVAFDGAFSQERPAGNVGKKQRQKDFFVNFSNTGAGAGFKLFYDAKNEDTKLGFGLLVTGVRGENEYMYWDYYYGGYRKGGGNFFTLLVPFNVSIKRRLFRESIASNLRPFVVAEAGPVWGIAFPKGVGGFSKSFNKGRGQLTFGAFIGFGSEFGDRITREIGVTLGIHFIKFPDALGEKDQYLGVDVRFSFLKSY